MVRAVQTGDGAQGRAVQVGQDLSARAGGARGEGDGLRRPSIHAHVHYVVSGRAAVQSGVQTEQGRSVPGSQTARGACADLDARS